jgi:acyl-CoA thioester hydrolase
MIYEQRVIFGDTDQMGVVYYANYLRYFEASRAAFLRSFGRSHADLDAWGVALPVVEAHCRYRLPARYEDLLLIEVVIGEVRPASMRFDYKVRRGGDHLADGWTRHASIGTDGRPRAIPPGLRALVDSPEARGTTASPPPSP